MPKTVHEKVGTIYRTREVKTLGDKIKETLGAIAGMVFVIWIIVMIISG
jgi:hypothetical protein